MIYNCDDSTINFDYNSFISVSTSFDCSLNSFNNSLFEINFIDCYFLNNSQKTNGGALQAAQNFNLRNVASLKTTKQMKKKKRALFISTNHKIDINSCSFVSNTALNGNGGAICIRNRDDLVNGIHLISNCSFISNKAIDGFAISIDGSYDNF